MLSRRPVQVDVDRARLGAVVIVGVGVVVVEGVEVADRIASGH